LTELGSYRRRGRWSSAVMAIAVAAAGCSSGQHARPAGNPPAATAAASPVTSTASPSTASQPPQAARPGSEAELPPPPVPDPVALPGGPLAPVISRVATTQPVVFLTIDDGWVRDPQVISFIRDRQLPVTVFLLSAAGRQDPGYFRALQAAGATIEDHTLTHPRLPTLGLAAQEHQICGAADDDARTYGARPSLMRPPYGLENRVTQAAAAACRMKAVVEWSAVVDGGRLTALGGHLQPGYILILHFRPTLLTDLETAVNAIQAAGLTVGRLESYMS
jgi:peptidoglycan/xylan/chitin deacetylase (PgdA/CDA1 family)